MTVSTNVFFPHTTRAPVAVGLAERVQRRQRVIVQLAERRRILEERGKQQDVETATGAMWTTKR